MTKRKEIVFVSNNPHKLEEIRQMIPADYRLLNLRDISLLEEIPEPFHTFEANALAKTEYVFKRTGLPCFADDSGLEVEALEGRPGVFSARYAGFDSSSDENVQKVLLELGNSANRIADFVAVIAYQFNDKESFTFTGKVEGTISHFVSGSGGFGYDPIFIPSGFDRTFAQLSPLVKNMISHRSRAMRLFADFLSAH